MLFKDIKPIKLVMLTLCLMWQTTLQAQCTKNGSYVELSGNWSYNNYSRTYDDDLIIDAGYTVTFTNSTIQFKHGAHIIIQPGAVLIVNHSTLTRACSGDTWGGIIAQGIASANQLVSSNTGICSIDTSVVEWADTAAVARPGGTVISTRSTFNNCRISIAIQPYSNPGKPLATSPCMIRDSKFICTDTIPGYKSSSIDAFISLEGVKNVVISGDSFINNCDNHKIAYNSNDFRDRGIGIKSHHASFVVYPSFLPTWFALQYKVWLFYNGDAQLESWYCDIDSTATHCYFNNLTIGIRHASFYPQYNANIIGADFINCQHMSVMCVGDYNATIRKCLFKTDWHGIADSNYQQAHIAVDMVSSKQYVIDSNIFLLDSFPLTVSSSTPFYFQTMLCLSNSTQSGGTIYSNRFITTPHSGVVPGSNYQIFGMGIGGGNGFQNNGNTGDMNPKVSLTCNTFSGFLSDIYIHTGIDGLIQDQGFPNLDAANKFSACVSGNQRISLSTGNNAFNYYTDKTNPDEYGSSCSNPYITFINVNNNNSCQPSSCLGTPR